jgi:hypothetical protein
VNNVQTLLAPKKPEAIDKDSAKEKPPKQNKRSHSDVANESAEGVDMIGIQSVQGFNGSISIVLYSFL